MVFTPSPPPGLRSSVVLPEIPEPILDEIHRWALELDSAIRDFYRDLSARLQSFVDTTSLKSGVLAFGPADTTKTLTFPVVQPDASYIPLIIPSWLTTFAVTSILATGFTITTGSAPGGGGGTIYWATVR